VFLSQEVKGNTFGWAGRRGIVRSADDLLLGEVSILIEFNVILTHSSLGVIWRSHHVPPVVRILPEYFARLYLSSHFLHFFFLLTKKPRIYLPHKLLNQLIILVVLLGSLHPRFQSPPGELAHKHVPVVEAAVGLPAGDFCVSLDLLLVGSMARNTLASSQEGSGPLERKGFLMRRASSWERRRQLGR
jgi:hypothetical protein